MRAKTPQKNDSFLVLGKVGRPHGLRGAFFVSGREDPIPKHLKKVLIGTAPEVAVEATITQSLMQANRPLLVCTLATDRTGAEKLTNLNIYAPRDAVRPSPKPNEIFWTDLEGADVFTSEGKVIGQITHIYNAGASDIATIESSDGRTLDIALTDDYVGKNLHLETNSGRRQVRLKVPADTFDELWEDA